MQKWRSSFLLLVLTAVCLPQGATQLVTPEIRRVGDKLACKCGVCNNTVATCQMLECHYSLPAREKIAQMQKSGLTDEKIVDSFVQESGLSALAAPPTEGFNLLGYLMPFVVITLGFIVIAAYMKRFRRPAVAATGDARIEDSYRKRIDQEMSDFD